MDLVFLDCYIFFNSFKLRPRPRVLRLATPLIDIYLSWVKGWVFSKANADLMAAEEKVNKVRVKDTDVRGQFLLGCSQ